MKRVTALLFTWMLLFATCCSAAITYTYDSLNRLTVVTYDDGSKVTYNYDAPGNIGSVVTSTNSTSATSSSTSTTTTTTGTTTTSTAGTTSTTLLATQTPGSVTLAAGWNLIGNGNNAALDVAATFGGSANVTTVWKWVAITSHWAFYAPSLAGQALSDYATGKGYDVLSTIAGGEGFWVNAKQSFSVQLPAGTTVLAADFQPAGSKALVQGWNLIASGDSKAPSDFNSALGASPPAPGVIPLNLTTLWAWDANLTNWYFYAPSLEAKGGTALADYITSKGYLDFRSSNKALGNGTGFWVNKP